MDGEDFFGAAYKGSKQFTQQQVKTANATGFGAAADDYAERGIDLNEQLIKNKPATFFFKMKGDAMQQVGIFDGDILIVDRQETARHGDVIVANFNGEFVCKILDKTHRMLLSSNEQHQPQPIHDYDNFTIEGVVIRSVRCHRQSPLLADI